MYQPEKLKRRRTEIGLRQIDVAEAIGISKQSYFAWEKGITQPNQKNLLKLEKVLEVGSIISVVGKTTVEIIELFKCTQKVP